MKQTRHISIYILSFLILYAGAGVSIFHHCCVKCENEKICCTACQNHEENHDNEDSCVCQSGCSVTVYSIDLIAKTIEDNHVSHPAFETNNRETSHILCATHGSTLLETRHNLPPPIAVNSRHYLALYSVLVI